MGVERAPVGGWHHLIFNIVAFKLRMIGPEQVIGNANSEWANLQPQFLKRLWQQLSSFTHLGVKQVLEKWNQSLFACKTITQTPCFFEPFEDLLCKGAAYFLSGVMGSDWTSLAITVPQLADQQSDRKALTLTMSVCAGTLRVHTRYTWQLGNQYQTTLFYSK